MKDIDFDELDRAVGSALGANDTPHPVTPPVVSVASVADSTPQDDAASTSSTEAPAQVAAPPVLNPASPARRRGQFLDMVHPSADMRSSTPLPSMVRKTIRPINVDTSPEPVSERPVEADTPAASYGSYSDPTASDVIDSNPVPETTEDAANTQDTTVEEQQPSWPDPIEFASAATKVDDSSVNEVSEQSSADAEYVAPEDETEAEPSQTPFVTDAKVDKRPLGAFTPTDEDPETQVVSEHAADTAQLTVSAETLAPEFSADLNSVEAAGVSEVESENAASSEVPESPAVETPDEPATPTTPAPSATNDGVAQSIPQQYKTADVKKDDDAHSLFDTKEYHQPLLPEGKKKSKKGVLIVILLIILLIIGATLGYFAYTMGI